MKKIESFVFVIFSLLLVIPGISAVTIDKTSLSFNDTSSYNIITFSQSNTTNINTINFTLDSSLINIIQLSLNQLSIVNSGTLNVSLKSNPPSGNIISTNGLHWESSDGTSGNVPIIISIASTTQGGCQLNPSIITYQQAISQNTETEIPKIIFNPTGCTGSFNIQSAYITGGVTTSSGIKPVYIKSLSSQEVLLGIDTNGLSSRTYSTKLTIVAFSKTFSEVSNINIVVTTGTNPASNFSINDLPICSLSSTTLLVNNTYSLVCTGIQPDVSIVAESNSNKIIGTNVESGNTQYIWRFLPTQIGTYNITAKFYYLSSQVGSQFNQEVKVSSTGSSGVGTNLKLLFTPSLDKAQPNQNVIVQLIDNSTESLVANPEIFIDAIKLNTTDGYTFYHKFDVNKNYSFRGRAVGYDDLVKSIGLGSLTMNLSVIPEDGDDSMQYNLSTPGVNATLFLDGLKIDNPYLGIISKGNHTIKGIAEGYFDLEKNFSIREGLRLVLESMWERSKLQYFSSNKNISWQVIYKKEIDSTEESSIASGNGNNISFTPNRKGLYQIKSDGVILWGQEIISWDWTLWGLNIFIWVGGLCFIIILGYVLGNRRTGSSDMPSFMGGNVNYG